VLDQNPPVDTDRYRVQPGKTLDLADHDPDAYDDDHPKPSPDERDEQLAGLTTRLTELQELFFADGRHRLLVVLQGMDTAGKDGAIKDVLGPVDPLGVRVANFKQPSEVELAHDYLWRVHAQTPGKGEITIFNRSHYEDVLVVRVHAIVPPDVWGRRYGHIADFERLLTDEGTTIRKFFLHISKDEQAERLQARLDDPSKNWKFAVGDLAERERWDDYQEAFTDALAKTSTKAAPWYVVPANRKWFRNQVIANVLIEALEGLDLRYPDPPPDLASVRIT
jgi:PPK2 family polyphosphate:nucleotide phosphotransferase